MIKGVGPSHPLSDYISTKLTLSTHPSPAKVDSNPHPNRPTARFSPPNHSQASNSLLPTSLSAFDVASKHCPKMYVCARMTETCTRAQ
jgi:hypothetical protein